MSVRAQRRASQVPQVTGSESLSTRERLLNETISVIEQGGETSVKIRDIGESCGVTSPIIYKLFASRDGLIIAAQVERFRRTIDSVAAPLTAAIAAAISVEELKTIVSELLKATQHPSRVQSRRLQIEVLGASIHRPALRIAVDEMLQSLISTGEEALSVAQRRGLLRQDLNLPEMLWWFYGQVQGRLLIEQSFAPLDEEAWNDTSRKAVFALMFSEDTPSLK